MSGQIPADLGSLYNLRRLYLEGNLLSGPMPPELGNLDNLTVLHLYGNRLSGQVPPELSNLDNLTVLHLYGNRLSGQVPSGLAERHRESNLAYPGWEPVDRVRAKRSPRQAEWSVAILLQVAIFGACHFAMKSHLPDPAQKEWC